MDYYLLVSSLTLFLQVGVFLLVISGFLLRKQKLFRAHGLAMFAGVILHLVSVIVIMVPSFVVGLVPFIAEKPSNVISIVSFPHAIVGSVAAILGVWIVFSWRLRHGLQFCAPKRKWMKLTLWIWLTSLTLGFMLYLALFWSALFG